MITFFAVLVITAIIVLTLLLLAGWLIGRPDTGRRAKPLSIEDQRTLRWAKSLNPKNVSRAGNPPGRSDGAPSPAAAPGKIAAATTPGPGHHHAHGGAGPATPPRGTCGQPQAGTNGGGSVRSDASRPGSVTEQLPVANEGHTGPGHSEACEPCTVLGCKPGCKCACHWGERHARADAWYGAPEFDAGLIARADRVLAGAL